LVSLVGAVGASAEARATELKKSAPAMAVRSILRKKDEFKGKDCVLVLMLKRMTLTSCYGRSRRERERLREEDGEESCAKVVKSMRIERERQRHAATPLSKLSRLDSIRIRFSHCHIETWTLQI
jgi:hypothetical protein